MTAEHFGRYQVKRPLGQGGMGIVHLAYDPQMTREVAIKVLPGHLMNDAEFRTRLEREVKTVAKLEHPCIVPVYDYGEEDRQPYVVMRYMTGGSLLNRIKQHPLTPTELSPIINRIARALDNAHSHNIIHRDIKPGNILFDDQNQAYLSDFGLAKVVAESTIQTGGAVLGTPAYMSPEQGSGLMQIDGRSDIYSLGIIVFEALTGQLPYQADTPIGMMMQHLTQEIPSLHQLNSNLSADYDILLQQAMAKTPDCRYAKASDLANDLAALTGYKKIYPRPELQENATEALPLSLDSQSRKTPVLSKVQAIPVKQRRWLKGLFVFGAIGLVGVGLFAGLMASRIFDGVTIPSSPTKLPSSPRNVSPSATASNGTRGAATALALKNPEPTASPTLTLTPEPTSTNTPTSTPTPEAVFDIPSSPTATRQTFFAISPDTQSPPPDNVVVKVIDNLLQAPDPLTAENSLVIDNFEGYGSNDALNSGFSINDAWGVNRGVLKLVAAPEGAEGAQALAFEFDINGDEPNDYSGFERKVATQDWSGYASLCFWLASDGSGYDLVLQFGEQESEVWWHKVALSRVSTEDLCIALEQDKFEWADWSTPGNQQINLETIDYYGIFVEGQSQGPGRIIIDNLRVVKPVEATIAPPPTLTPTPTVAVCAAEPQGAFRAAWEQHKGRLGCPNLEQINPISGFFAEQPFENGHMYWSEIGNFYLVTIGTAEGNWRFFEGDESIWQEGMPQKSCDIPTPPGLIHPIRGFGGLWCQHEDIRNQIGWGTKKEEGFTDLIQTFDGGFIFQDSDGVTNSFVYVLFTDNGTFIRANY